MQTGALIAAAGKTSQMSAFRPLLKLNGTTLIQKEIDTLRRAGVSPIVVITGYAAEKLEHHLAHRGVVCIRNEAYAETQMLDSIKMGLEYLKDRCDRILFLPADAPLFSVKSLDLVIEEEEDIVIPFHDKKSGHPILLSKKVFDHILNYSGENGLKGAIASSGITPRRVEVEDPGIWMEVHDDETYRQMLEYEKRSIEDQELRYKVKVILGKENPFFGPGTAEFLQQIDTMGSMLAACKEMDMSYSKGWKMVKEVEDSLGFSFLERRAGGANGGNSSLTEKGREFLSRYQNMQRAVTEASERYFQEFFGDQSSFSLLREQKTENDDE